MKTRETSCTFDLSINCSGVFFIFKTPVALDLIGLQILTSYLAARRSLVSDFNLNLQRVSVPQEMCVSLQAIVNITKLQHYFICVPKGTHNRDHRAREDKRRGLKIFIAETLILFYLFLLSECQARRGEKLICTAGRLENVLWKTGARERGAEHRRFILTRWHGIHSTQTSKMAGRIVTRTNTTSHTSLALPRCVAWSKAYRVYRLDRISICNGSIGIALYHICLLFISVDRAEKSFSVTALTNSCIYSPTQSTQSVSFSIQSLSQEI